MASFGFAVIGVCLKSILVRRWLQRRWWAYFLPLLVKARGVHLIGTVRFHGMPIIEMSRGSSIEIHGGSTICSVPWMTALGVDHPTVLRTLRLGARLSIGSNTGISGGSFCAANSIVIGSECLIGADVIVTDTDFHAVNPKGRRFNDNPNEIAAVPIVIEDNVFIGTRAIILKGVRIGQNSIIAAGSIVTKSIPPNCVAAGAPAKVVKKLLFEPIV